MMLPVLQQAEIAPPRGDMPPEGAREDARQLRGVRHVVRRPAGDELFERHGAELRMLAGQAQVRRGEPEPIQLLEVRAPPLAELADEGGGGPATAPRKAPFAIERRETAAARQDLLDPRHPVGDLA